MEWEQPNYSYTNTYSQQAQTAGAGLRRRGQHTASPASFTNSSIDTSGKYDKSIKRNFKKLDMFPKVEKDLTVKRNGGRLISAIGFGLTIIIVLAEIFNHRTLNSAIKQHMTVDKSLGKKMRVELNITFPALHCNDVHIDIMDITGDAHNDVDDTIQKTRLHLDGSRLSLQEVKASVNKAHELEVEALAAIDKSLAPDYCGPCYGAPPAEEGNDCCNHCDDVVAAYKKKNWDHTSVKMLAEQCIREGKTKPQSLTGGEGCRIAGFMEFGRVNGNFHIAMGEGVERNGQHIHTFLPEETKLYNISHIIHELRFGPVYHDDNRNTDESTSLEGVSKIMTEHNGISGMFQYFIKIVPTAYKGEKIVKEIDPNFDMNKEPLLETNRYFVTERFTPLVEPDDEHWALGDLFLDDDEMDDDGGLAGVKVGGKTGLSHDKHEHLKQKAILPGIFFIYQVYPFTVEVSKEEIPLTHLLIRILATIGGAFTIVGWLDTLLYSKRQKKVGLGR